MNPPTLADCVLKVKLWCLHCGKEFPMSSPVEKFGNYVVVECAHCRCVTPFKAEKSA
jgi:transcription elongation factor Elf1